jgi:hypothetical protein
MRLSELARRTVQDPTAIALIVANVVACALAVRHPPVVMTVLYLYWAECAVIGVVNAVKLWYIRDERLDGSWQVKTLVLGFLSVHYMFAVVIAGGMLWMLGGLELQERGMPHVFDWADYSKGFLLPVLCLAATHIWSFFRNFLGRREYEGRTLEQQQFRPYRRVAAMFAVVLFCGLLIIWARGPELAVLLAVPFKLVADLRAHFRDHRRKPPEPPQYPQELRLL